MCQAGIRDFRFGGRSQTLRVQVPNIHTFTQNQYYNYYCLIPKYLLIGYMDPLEKLPVSVRALSCGVLALWALYGRTWPCGFILPGLGNLSYMRMLQGVIN